MKFVFKQINYLYPSLREVIALSVGSSTKEKIDRVLASYREDNNYIIGCLLDDKLVALIGFECINQEGNIKHISVLDTYRFKGIARKLVEYVIKSFSLKNLLAETDEDSIIFYQKLGFIYNSFMGKYGLRYKCVLALETNNTNNMEIRLLKKEDYENWKQLRLEALQNYPESFGSSYEEEINTPIKDSMFIDQDIFAAFIGSKLVAMVGFSIFKMKKMSHRGVLFGMYAKLEYRGKNIADKLMLAVIDHAKTKVTQLHLTCITKNSSAIKLYEKHGFKIYGTEPRALKIGVEYFDEHLMVLDLT